MIKINLLPAQYRREKKNASPVPYLSVLFLVAGLFVLLTLFFFIDYLKVKTSHGVVSKEWQRFNPQMAQLKDLETKVETEMKNEKSFFENYVLNDKNSVTRMMIWASEYLPPQGWLTEVKMDREGEGYRLILQGMVYSSRAKTGIEQIEEFLNQLKAKLPKATLNLTTSKNVAKDKGSEGTSFVASFEMGIPKKAESGAAKKK